MALLVSALRWIRCYFLNQNYNKILERDLLSPA